MKSGLAVARYLENHPCVDRVIHPGKIVFYYDWMLPTNRGAEVYNS